MTSDSAFQQLLKLCDVSNVRVTFSKNCISGIVSDCGCRRCRRSRGEEPTNETEQAAEQRSRFETARFREQQRDWIRKELQSL